MAHLNVWKSLNSRMIDDDKLHLSRSLYIMKERVIKKELRFLVLFCFSEAFLCAALAVLGLSL